MVLEPVILTTSITLVGKTLVIMQLFMYAKLICFKMLIFSYFTGGQWSFSLTNGGHMGSADNQTTFVDVTLRHSYETGLFAKGAIGPFHEGWLRQGDVVMNPKAIVGIMVPMLPFLVSKIYGPDEHKNSRTKITTI